MKYKGKNRQNDRKRLGDDMRMKSAACSLVAMVFSLWQTMQGFPDIEPVGSDLLAHDFNSGDKATEYVQGFGSWDGNPNDPEQGCKAYLDAIEKHGGQGMSLRLDYDVDSTRPAFNGLWMRFKNLNLSDYQFFNFYVKGDPVKGFPDLLKLELKTGSQIGVFRYQGVTDQWQLVKIPFTSFPEITNWSVVTEFAIGFEDGYSNPKTGTVYIDDVFFSKN